MTITIIFLLAVALLILALAKGRRGDGRAERLSMDRDLVSINQRMKGIGV